MTRRQKAFASALSLVLGGCVGVWAQPALADGVGRIEGVIEAYLKRKAILDSSGTYSGGASGLPTGYITGLKITYSDSHTVSVASGSARDSSDAADLSLAASTNIDMDTTGASGMDASTLSGTGALAAGTLTGSSTSFLTGFGTKSATGTLTTSGTAGTGTGTRFLTEARVNDLIGNASNGYSKITAITDDTHVTLVAAIPGGNLTGATIKIIENPTVSCGSVRTTVEKIVSDTSLTTSDTTSSVAAGATVKAGVKATTSAGLQVQRHYAVWLVGSSLYASTQRTTLFASGSSKRRIGWVTTSDGSTDAIFTTPVAKGDILPFQQIGSGPSRTVYFIATQNFTGTAGDGDILAGGGAGAASLTSLWLNVAPPTATSVHLQLEIAGPTASRTMLVQSRAAASMSGGAASCDEASITAATGADINAQVYIGCDSAQYITYTAPADANHPFYIYFHGYVDEL